jgi:hypothetical protein
MSAEFMGIKEGDEVDVSLLSFSNHPRGAARFGTSTMFVVKDPPTTYFNAHRMQMGARYMPGDEERASQWGKSVGDEIDEGEDPEYFYDALENDGPNATHEVIVSGSYRVASVEERWSAHGTEPYETPFGTIPGVDNVVTLEWVADVRDGDGDGFIWDGTDRERWAAHSGVSKSSRRPAWLALLDRSLRESQEVPGRPSM